VSVPVDIGIDHARTPQDMAVEFWLSHAMYGTQKVINLATNFENLPNVPLNDVDEAIHYTLVMESQVRCLMLLQVCASSDISLDPNAAPWTV
jgi:hypothetical protein